MSKMDVHYSSDSDEWETPQWLFDELNREFNLKFDLCGNSWNAKCTSFSSDVELFYANYEDEPFKNYYMNPPYSRGKQKVCLEYAKLIADKGNTVVALVPARTDTKAWHEYIWDTDKQVPKQGVEVRFLKGRLKFEKDGKPLLDKSGRPQSAPFPSAVVIFRGTDNA